MEQRLERLEPTVEDEDEDNGSSWRVPRFFFSFFFFSFFFLLRIILDFTAFPLTV